MPETDSVLAGTGSPDSKRAETRFVRSLAKSVQSAFILSDSVIDEIFLLPYADLAHAGVRPRALSCSSDVSSRSIGYSEIKAPASSALELGSPRPHLRRQRISFLLQHLVWHWAGCCHI
jgi:hypothetical protein